MRLEPVLGPGTPEQESKLAAVPDRIEHRLQEQEKLLLTARVEALASQINPHFLFNTLTSISSLIRTKPETARTVIVKLSGLLRRLLRSRDHFVTLREELQSRALDPMNGTPVKLAELGPDAGMIGAAAMALIELDKES